jgi:hypothetical protein
LSLGSLDLRRGLAVRLAKRGLTDMLRGSVGEVRDAVA